MTACPECESTCTEVTGTTGALTLIVAVWECVCEQTFTSSLELRTDSEPSVLEEAI